MTECQSPKMLVIVSEDFGELGHATYFLTLYQEWDVKVAIPQNRMDIADHLDPKQKVCYRTFQDCEQILEEHKPVVVVLFSGYLLYTHEPYSFIKYTAFLTRLKSNGVQVLTSDPLLGIDIKLLSGNFAISSGQRRSIVQLTKSYIKSIYLAGRLQVLRRHFANDTHIYPVPVTDRINVKQPVYYRSNCFFEAIAQQPCNEKHLVFVIAEIDYYRLLTNHPSFVSEFVKTVNTLAEQGYVVQIVGTSALKAELCSHMLHSQIQCYGTLSFSQYNHMLDTCECAFFWNYFSFSVYRRILTAKPVIFLDEGHMLSMFPDLKKLGTNLLFNHQCPPVIAFTLLLDPVIFKQLKDDSVYLSQQIREYYHSQPTDNFTALSQHALVVK
ncbi:hypothetical protein FJ444_17290 [Aestuariibacter sp. GS-14]|uniref:hypothetical protein n=1 Tax=Aestuariibacter sp. GS-14 TaxID=2590670 RepID=UPI00112EF97D|nr:hypothetical protein [Aestuariibacter sp. GS-14]TPV55451.1 hypothetical protein FJ444_17290 [Aestuariibacter sp. GS-14]